VQWLDTHYIIIDSQKDKPISKEQNQVLREPSGLIKKAACYEYQTPITFTSPRVGDINY
jgi:hypothetical protein